MLTQTPSPGYEVVHSYLRHHPGIPQCYRITLIPLPSVVMALRAYYKGGENEMRSSTALPFPQASASRRSTPAAARHFQQCRQFDFAPGEESRYMQLRVCAPDRSQLSDGGARAITRGVTPAPNTMRSCFAHSFSSPSSVRSSCR